MKSRFLNVEAGSRRTVKVMWCDLRKVQLATADLKMEERATSQRIWQLLDTESDTQLKGKWRPQSYSLSELNSANNSNN